ncbi:MAG: helix-turn-helix transcriptional regulator [Brevundimonas sp.]|nr:helix-turn-helix transcriptional regulator [Brevundimonas sp.]
MNVEIGSILSSLRDAAGKTQKSIATDMANGNQTRVSRLENGEGSREDVLDYLEALNTDEAKEFGRTLLIEWSQLPQPSLKHPDLKALIAIEAAITEVRDFLKNGNAPAVVAGQAELLAGRLDEVGRYLLNLDHQVVYVGQIGVGKTTAACRQANLVEDRATAGDLKGMLLDTGGGRTTICEVEVRQGDRFSLTVEPVADEEIYRLVGEISKSLEAKAEEDGATTPSDFKPPEEVERALRNMAALPRPPRARKGAVASPDPARTLFETIGDREAFAAEFAAKLSLWRRTRREIEFEGGDETAGRKWLKSVFTQINNGRHAEFSLPDRILITVPFNMIGNDRLDISIVDTRGVDGSAIRTDILGHLRDERSLTLLCSTWGAAPDLALQELLRHIIASDADRRLLDRVALVVLARAGEALSMRHDNGDNVEEEEEGYGIKLEQVEDAFHKVGIIGVEPMAYDAGGSDPEALSRFITAKVRTIRARQVTAAYATIDAAHQMLANVEQAQALAALETVSKDLLRFANRNETLEAPQREPYALLLSAIRGLNARTVWAATRRQGRFWNLDAFQYLGDGAASEAKRRSRKVLGDLEAVLEARRDDPELESAYAYIAEVLANSAKWEADFVDAARHHAVAVFLEPLRAARDVWERCEYRYGSGYGSYRGYVADQLEEWFTANRPLSVEVERRITGAWKATIATPLREATGT